MFKKHFSLSIALFTTMILILTACDGSDAMSLIGKAAPTVNIAKNITIPDDGKRLVVSTNTTLYGIRIVDGQTLWSTKAYQGGGNVWANGQNAYVTYNNNGNGLADLNIQNGKPIWNVPFDTTVSYLQSNSNMVFISEGSTVYGLTASSGQAQWKQAFAQNSMQLVLNQNTLFAGDQLVAAMDTATGNILWQSSAMNGVQQMAVVGNTLVVLTKDTIYGLSINNGGQTLWNDPVIGGSFVSSGTMVYVKYSSNLPPQDNGEPNPNGIPGIEAIQANSSGTNNIVWTTDENITNGDVNDLISFTPSTAYIEQAGDMVDQVVSLQLANKHVQWTVPAAPPVNHGVRTETGDTIAAINEGSEEIYALTKSNNIYAFNPPDGTQLWEVNQDDSKRLMTTQNDIFVVTTDNVISLDPLTGTKLWTANTDGTMQTAVTN